MRTKIYSTIVLFSIILFGCISCNFAPGSYPYAELYEFKVSEVLLVEAVEKFKDENPKYCLPEQERFIDGRKNEREQWYHVWFYYPQENQIVKCWIRTSRDGNAELGFVGIGNVPSLSDYKEINKDFSHKENKLQKEKFEQRILNEITKQLE